MPATNVQKVPFARSLNDAMRDRASNAVQLVGKTLPCSVTRRVSSKIVTVKFEINAAPFTLPPVTMPVFGSEYIREPIQVGCKGMAIAADAYLGQISGLGSGTATLNQQANLSDLMFMPMGNAGLADVDLNKLVLYGQDGVIIRPTVAGTPQITMTATSITLAVGSHSIVIDSTGVTIDGRLFLAHEHTGVTIGIGNTGGVV